MNQIFVFAFVFTIIILAFVGFVATVKSLFNQLQIIWDRIKIKRKRIANIDIIENLVCLHTEKMRRMKETLDKVEKIANNFDRDMNTYHEKINKGIDERMFQIATRLKELERTAPNFLERIKTIENRQKTYDTSLLTQAKMIGDFQNQFKKPARASK